jgi:hypothetical protein
MGRTRSVIAGGNPPIVVRRHAESDVRPEAAC